MCVSAATGGWGLDPHSGASLVPECTDHRSPKVKLLCFNGAAFYTTCPTRRSDVHLNIFLTFALPLRTAGYAMVSAARPDLQLVSLSHVSGLSSLRSAAEVAVISLLASAP